MSASRKLHHSKIILYAALSVGRIVRSVRCHVLPHCLHTGAPQVGRTHGWERSHSKYSVARRCQLRGSTARGRLRADGETARRQDVENVRAVTFFEQASPVQVAVCESVPHMMSHVSPLRTIWGWEESANRSAGACDSWGEFGGQRQGSKPEKPLAVRCARVAGTGVGPAAAHSRLLTTKWQPQNDSGIANGGQAQWWSTRLVHLSS